MNKNRRKEEYVVWDDLDINEKEALLMHQAGRGCNEIKQITGLSWNKIEKLDKMVKRKEE